MGSVRFEIRTSMTARLLERCMEKGIPIERAEDADAHGFAAWVSDGDEARMRAFLDELHVPYRVRGAKGAARLKRFLRARAALLPALCVCAALSLLLYGAGFSRERGRSLLMALSLGVLWQVVTLTSFGARLVAAIDHIFCSEKREVKS